MKQTKQRIQKAFKERKEDEKLMSLFLTAGYPDLDSTVDLVLGMDENGADMIELGMPFSDPLADGPTIQHSSQQALDNGITLARIFDMIREIRQSSEIPIILMGYMNPVLHYGIEKFCKDAVEAGADGLIIPDLPVEESTELEKEARERGLSLIYLVAPNSTDDRMKLIDQQSEGFVYCVSVTGVTGAREGDEVAKSVSRFIDRVVTNVQKNPRMIGFGIRSYRDAQNIAAKVEGFIVGSALIDAIRKSYPNDGWKNDVFSFVKTLKYGTESIDSHG